MELPVGHQKSRKEFWIKHIEAAEAFDGSIRAYCQLHGLKPGSMSSYRNKLGYSRTRRNKAKKQAAQFVPVEVFPKPIDTPASDVLPDPEWLVRFLKAWGH